MTQNSHPDPSITIRTIRDDEPALLDLAQLDSGRVPTQPMLGAERDGQLIAAISIHDGELIADPFRHTAEASELLRVRRSQLNGHAPRKRRFRRRSRASLPASPPGAGGRLIQLPRSEGGWARIT
jgi:hypothetical protein